MPSKPKPQSSPSAEASAPRRRTKPTTTPRTARSRKAAEPEAASPAPKPARRRAAKKLAAAAVAVESVPPIAPPEPQAPAADTPAIAAESVEFPAEPLPPPSAWTPRQQAGADAPPAGWLAARQPAAWTASFLGMILALTVGYSAGRSADGDDDPTVVVAHGAARPEPDPIAAAVEEAIEDARATAEPEPAPAVEEAEAAPPAEPTGLHLQVSALKSRRAAAALQRRLERGGLPARTLEPASDDLIRVVVGPTEDRETLGAWAAQLRSQGLKPFPKRF